MKRIWLIVLGVIFGSLICSAAFGQGQPSAGVPPGHESIVRIIVDDGNGTSRGSGTIVGRKDGVATVLTAAHLLRDRRGDVIVVAAGQRCAARVLLADAVLDLAALQIRDPGLHYVHLTETRLVSGAQAWASGYGAGSYRQVGGRFVQYLSPDDGRSWDWAEFSCPVRDGDSGGPVLDTEGRLVAVVSARGEGRTCGPCFPRIRAFLGTALGCRGGWCPTPPRAGNLSLYPQRPMIPRFVPQGPVRIVDLPRPQPPSVKVEPPPETPKPQQPAEIDYDRLAALVFARIEANAEKFRGAPGEPGVPGVPGRHGQDGSDGTSATLDYDALTQTVVSRLPPQRVEWQRLDGQVLTQEKPLGEPLRFKSVEIDARK